LVERAGGPRVSADRKTVLSVAQKKEPQSDLMKMMAQVAPYQI
jgi:hypothetical protein